IVTAGCAGTGPLRTTTLDPHDGGAVRPVPGPAAPAAGGSGRGEGERAHHGEGGAGAGVASPAMAEPDRYRLPTTVVPSRYDLELAPDLGAATCSGTVAIAVDVREPVDEVVVNALDLEITSAEVELADGTRLAASVSLDPELERATLALPSTAPA